jgi:hypothetical protein
MAKLITYVGLDVHKDTERVNDFDTSGFVI